MRSIKNGFFLVFFVTETWLTTNTNILNLDILEKLNIVFCNRINRRGGGCAILIRKHIKFFLKQPISKFNS